MKKYIYHHLGLGDHLICNGLVREITKNKNNEFNLFCYKHNRASVEFMYKDLNNLKIIEISSVSEVENFFKKNNINSDDIYMSGVLNEVSWSPNSKSFEESFYKQNGLEISYKWNLFKVDRDLTRESILKQKLGITDDSDYIFIHDDERFKIDEEYIKSNLKKIRPTIGLTDNIFDYCSVLENAKEIHLIESSFCFMVDLLKLNNYVFVHRYARWQNDFGIPEYKNVYKIIQKK